MRGVDHRSLKEQGIEREPTVHVGYAGMEIAARGGQSERMDALKAVMARNDIRVEMKALDGELRELDEQRRAKPAQSQGPEDWTDRGGMVAQQEFAMRAVHQPRSKEPDAPGDNPGKKAESERKKLIFYEDIHPDKGHDRDR